MGQPSVHIGLSIGRLSHWHHGIGEFSRQLGSALAARASELRDRCGWRFHFHLPTEFHGVFGAEVGYLATHTTQRWLHLQRPRFALWHRLHQHNRLRRPLGADRLVETVHDLNFLHVKSGARLETYRRRHRRRLARGDAAIAITHHVAEEVRRELAPIDTRLCVIHNGATDLTALPRIAVDGLSDRPYFLHLSRMAPSKNVAALLDLAAAWNDRHFVFAGPRSVYTETLQRTVAERGLRNTSFRLDVAEGEKAWLYAHCDAFLFPSLTEGFGLPPLEAMHFGKSVFLSPLTSLPEVGGDAAHYFGDFGPASMIDVIEAGLDADRAPGRKFAIESHARRFSWARCAEAHVSLYAELLQAPGR